MLLRYSSYSPFVRKVLIVAHELGISDLITPVPTVLKVPDDEFLSENPLGKIPALKLDNGVSYFDSKVICEYLDAKYGQGALLPKDGDQRWQALTRISLSDGVVDAGLLARQESMRSEQLRDPNVETLQMGKVTRGLDRLEDIAATEGFPTQFDMVGITVASGLGWLVLRFGAEPILGSRPALSAWYRRVCERPSMQATDHERAAAAAAQAGK